MNIKNLRKSILQYAVEGKLVQQDIQDESASILYDKIIKEKENLINQGRISSILIRENWLTRIRGRKHK